MIASTCGITIAPAAPCAIRAMTSVSGLGASPQAADADREQDQPDRVDAPAAEHVAEPAGGDQEAART